MNWEWVDTEGGEFVDTESDEWLGRGAVAGKVCWGQSTGIDEDTAQELANWAVDGSFASGTGDSEVMYFYADGGAISPVWNLGVRNNARIVLNKYQSGDTIETVLYRTGATSGDCLAASWIPYSGPFSCLGWAQIWLLNHTTCAWDDYFVGSDGDPPDPTKWLEVDDNSVLSIQSNKLNLNYTGTVYNSPTVSSKFYFEADKAFDVRIFYDITAMDTPDSNDNFLMLNIRDIANNYHSVRRRRLSTGTDHYVYQNNVDGGGQYVTADTSGRLRLTRAVDGTFTAYVWNATAKHWEWDGDTGGHVFTTKNTNAVFVRFVLRHEATAAATTVNANLHAFQVWAGCGDTYTTTTTTSSSSSTSSTA